MDNFDKRLAKLLEDRNLTQADLSRMSGVSTAKVAQLCTGATKDPRISTLSAIANALDVSIDDLIKYPYERELSADKFKQLISEKVKNIAVLADMIGVPRTTIYTCLENDEKVMGMSLKVFIKISDALEMSLDDVIKYIEK